MQNGADCVLKRGLMMPDEKLKPEFGKAPYLINMHYRIETACDQLVQRFHDKRVWARALRHLSSRWMRKLLRYTLTSTFCLAGICDLRYAQFIVT
jgi:hypothetical protein